MRKVAQKGWLLPFVPKEYRPQGQYGNDDWDIFHAMIVGSFYATARVLILG